MAINKATRASLQANDSVHKLADLIRCIFNRKFGPIVLY